MSEADMEDGRWQRRASILICGVIGAVAIWAVFRFASGVVAVVAIAWGMAATVTPLAKGTSRVLGIPRKLCAAVYVLLLFGLAGALLAWGVSRLWRELEGVFGWLEENRVWLELRMDWAVVAWDDLLSALPLGEGASVAETLERAISGWLDHAVSALGSALASGVGVAAKSLPRFLLCAVVTVMASLYMSMDYEVLRDGLIGMLPSRLGKRIESLRKRASGAIRGYIRAYLILMGMTFCEVFIGLAILGQPYAFLIALAVALVDILPVVGAGVILIPWAIGMLIGGDPSFGVGILILYGVVTVVRQIAEPRLVGESLGLHPLVSLLSMFGGFWIFGVWGMLLGPAAMLVLKACVRSDGVQGK